MLEENKNCDAPGVYHLGIFCISVLCFYWAQFFGEVNHTRQYELEHLHTFTCNDSKSQKVCKSVIVRECASDILLLSSVTNDAALDSWTAVFDFAYFSMM